MAQIDPATFRFEDYDFVIAVRRPIVAPDAFSHVPPIWFDHGWDQADRHYRATTMVSLASAALYGTGMDVAVVPERLRGDLAQSMHVDQRGTQGLAPGI